MVDPQAMTARPAAAVVAGNRRGGKMEALGRTTWVIAEGWIPPYSHGPEPAMLSHETACLLNTGDRDAQVEITIFYEDREPAGPYRVTVPARRTLHQRFNDLKDPDRSPLAPTTPR
jgi:hypothetical protein